ncbi:hypothetical protein HAX54_043478, partial [Datura stramonium]|nr:hypothetical protein [Datura stramonium]
PRGPKGTKGASSSQPRLSPPGRFEQSPESLMDFMVQHKKELPCPENRDYRDVCAKVPHLPDKHHKVKIRPVALFTYKRFNAFHGTLQLDSSEYFILLEKPLYRNFRHTHPPIG